VNGSAPSGYHNDVYRYTETQPQAERFSRDRWTVLAYAAVACWAFWLYAFGPALALLRDELHFSYTLLGVYAALLSGGGAVAGAVYPAAARRWSRGGLLWGSAIVATAGAGLFALGADVAATLAGAAVLGLAGTVLLTVTQAVLSDRHGPRRDQALTEANVGAAGCAVVAPLALGALAAGPLGWQAAFAVPVLGLATLRLWNGRRPLPSAPEREVTQDAGRLPAACWLFNGLVAAGMAAEFCLVYFGAEHLRSTGLSVAASATALSGYYVGILAGRIGGAVATRRPDRGVPLLVVSLGVTGAGFLVFWLVPDPTLAVAGLFLAGVGIANLYPLSVALVLATSGGREDQANARTQLLGGLTLVAAPFLLGGLADRFGLTVALGLEAALIGLCVLLLAAGLRVQRAAAPAGHAPVDR
jgi:MFS family permease